jgi:hypothetical protein
VVLSIDVYPEREYDYLLWQVLPALRGLTVSLRAEIFPPQARESRPYIKTDNVIRNPWW